MPNQLSPEIRKKLLDRVLFQKISVAKACRESRISRYTFYKWLKRQQGGKDLKDKKRQVKHYWRQPSEEIIKIIKRIILAHPDWSKYKIHSALPKDEKGKIILGVHGVYNILRHLSLSSSKERQAFKEASLTNKFRSLSSQKRLFIIDRVKKASIPVAKVCIEAGISRFTYYKWLKRYASHFKEKGIIALSDKKREVKRWGRQTSAQQEELILKIRF